MTRLISARRAALLVLGCLWWSGCSPSGETGLDGEKDPNYLAGRSLRTALNYTAAIEAFEKALETNPRSAAAHLELGLIYYQNVGTNWARAIYHFEKYLALRPKANNADLIRQDIDNCKLALAKEVPYTPGNELVRREVERLARENVDLRQQLEDLKAQLALRPATAANGGQLSARSILPTQNRSCPPRRHQTRPSSTARRPNARRRRLPPTKRRDQPPPQKATSSGRETRLTRLRGVTE